MAFWTSPNIHPKTKSRFIVSFGTSFFLPNVKSVTKPAVEVQTKEYRLMNHYFNYPGLVRWQPITITFVDLNGEGDQFDTSQMLAEMLNNSGYAPPTEENHPIGKNPDTITPITTPEKASTIANSFGNGLYETTNRDPSAPNPNNRTLRIQQLDSGFLRNRNNSQQLNVPNALVVEEWVLANPIITNITWGDLDYGSDDLVECTLEIKYDWAEFNKGGQRPIVDNTYQNFSK